ncbi:prolyl oligopeptidase family serine peptidase [Flavobacteriaceae bacterium F89]|uniref:Prolyl oligopeptidase family serine peptidase n=1 Tax=Cerina litoralis TaxID=2874477 RepID=A0AAE3ES50_9FLAO|nr:prolyl oligopeptidase family serine peptidase [Cerina litoralis]MCG2460227.1 prolyl oligopeptidase family serine peptidase [Cerina litoralis]
MKTTSALFSILLLLICTVAKAQNDDGINDVKTDSIKMDNIFRSYTYYVPKDIKKSSKLIFILHGSTMKSSLMITATGYQFNRHANTSKDEIIVYPQGFETYWNDCRKSATYSANLLNLNEAGFFKAVIAKFYTDYGIDTSQVFVTGFSNGGHMVYKLAMENPALFKGFAAISASLPVESNNDCVSKNQPVSILIANGTTDSISPFNGGTVLAGDGKNRGDVAPTFNSVQYFKDLMKCGEIIETKKGLPDTDKEDSSTVNVYDYRCKNQGKRIELIEIVNGGHIFPNPTFDQWPKSLGNVNKDVNLPELILNFFNSLE